MKNTIAFCTRWVPVILLLIPLTLLSQNKLYQKNNNSGKSVELSAINHSRAVNSDSTWIHYDDVENFEAWGFLVAGEIYDVMSKWDPDSLVNYDGWAITRIKFFVVNSLPVLQVKVWEGPDATEIYSQDVPNFNVNNWTEVVLDSAVAFDHTKELYFGYKVDMSQTIGGFVTATDDGPPVDGYGNLVRWQGTWLSEYNNHNLRAQINNMLTANFEADKTVACDSSEVQFTNAFSGAESYLWTFEGGTPSTSTNENPTVVYYTPGIYDVTLEVTNGNSTELEYKEDYIRVLEIPGQIEGDSIVNAWSEGIYSVPANLGSSYTWEADNGEIVAGQGTYEVNVSWMGAGTGYVSVVEETIYDCQGQSGSFHVTINDPTGLNDNVLQHSLVVSPNPVQGDELTVEMLNNEVVPVIIHDLSGRMVIQEELNADKTTINIGSLSKGVYVLKALFNDGFETVKVIRQ